MDRGSISLNRQLSIKRSKMDLPFAVEAQETISNQDIQVYFNYC